MNDREAMIHLSKLAVEMQSELDLMQVNSVGAKDMQDNRRHIIYAAGVIADRLLKRKKTS